MARKSPRMGYTKVKAKIANPVQLNRFLDAELPVDTGAVYMLANGNSLKDFGIKSEDGMDFYSINIQKLTRRVGVSMIKIMGRKMVNERHIWRRERHRGSWHYGPRTIGSRNGSAGSRNQTYAYVSPKSFRLT